MLCHKLRKKKEKLKANQKNVVLDKTESVNLTTERCLFEDNKFTFEFIA